MSSDRHFANPFSDYDPADHIVIADRKISPSYQNKIHQCRDQLMGQLDKGIKRAHNADPQDHSVYTGVAGFALLHLRLSRTPDGKFEGEHLVKAETYISEALKHLDGRHIAFLIGDPGVLALAVVIYKHLGRINEVKVCVNRLIEYHKKVFESGYRPQPNEILFGKSGYLHCLLLVHKEMGGESPSTAIIRDVFESVIKSGRHLANQMNLTAQTPMMFEWHDSQYLGAAHGLAGIYYMLMQSLDVVQADEHTRQLVESAIDYCITLRYPSGNYPSSLGSTTDKLIHWCHGAPGFIHMFIKAYKVFGHERYLKEAESCANVIWKRGLLKGYGICHGVSGNAYAFLAMWQLTGKEKYIYRAVKFAEWLFDYGSHCCRQPDTPFSLFEGMAGSVYFLSELLLNPSDAQFPAYFGLP